MNNAGITRDNLLLRMKDDEWDEIMATNLKAVFRLSKAVLRGDDEGALRPHHQHHLRRRQHRQCRADQLCCGQGGRWSGFTKALAREVGSRNITVNCVAPGFIDTDMTRACRGAAREAARANSARAAGTRRKTSRDAVVFLRRRGAAYITGATLHVNGGMHMD